MLSFRTSSSARADLRRGVDLVRLGAREVGFARGDLRPVGRLLDDEQQIALIDLLALLEPPLLEEAGHPRPQVDEVDRLDSAPGTPPNA